jgi:hypothetical protein
MLFGHVELRFRAYFLVEAKYREGVEWFAFDSPHSASLPADSNSPFSSIMTDRYSAYADRLAISRLAALKTGARSSGQEPSIPYKEENLTQNVGGELANVANHIAGNLAESNPRPMSTAHGEELLAHFKEQLQNGRDWRDALRAFLTNLHAREHQRFLSELSGSHPLTLRLFIPMMVVNGRINHAAMDSNGNIGDLAPAETVVTGERLRGWPPREPFISQSIQFPVIVTNPDGLNRALTIGYDYALKVRNGFALAGNSGALNGTSLDSSFASLVRASLSDLVPASPMEERA